MTVRTTPTAKKVKLCSKDEAYAKSSAIAATRLSLTVDWPTLVNLVQNFAVLTSYHIQSKGVPPEFLTSNANAWNPSMIFAFYMALVGNKLAKAGALGTSNEILALGSHYVPVFFGKWLQQIGTAKHMGRQVTSYLDKYTVADFYNYGCGNGGIGPFGAALAAPCYVPVAGDTEGYWAVGSSVASTISAATLNPQNFSQLSKVIQQSFKHTVKVEDIPLMAASTELKCTPVADGINGQLMFSCVDDKTMCDLILPLCSFYGPTLVNSMCPVQVAAPVRLDGGLVMCQESKIAFLFWLGNQFAWDPHDTFRRYLTKFGVQEQHMGNLQINLRQINYQSLYAQIMNFCFTLCPDLSGQGYWYLVNYLITVLVSSIPGCLRAFSPLSNTWNLAPVLNKANPSNPCYSSFIKNPRVPNFIAQMLYALQRPIRTANQITYFCNVLQSSYTTMWWEIPLTPGGGNMNINGAANYGHYQSSPYDTNLRWDNTTGSPIIPYPGFTNVASPGLAYRNYICTRGTASATSYFSTNLTMPNGGQNLWNQLSIGGVKFTKRMGKYYIHSVLQEDDLGYPLSDTSPQIQFGITNPVPKVITSWEASSHHAAILAVVHLATYFSPSDFNVATIGSVFSATPALGTIEAAAVSMSASNPGQGTPQQIELAKKSNQAEAAAHMGADACDGVVPDQSKPLAKENMEHAKEKFKETTKDIGDEVVKEANIIINDAAQAF